MTQPSDFSPESMVKWTRTMAEEAAPSLDQTHRLIAIRSVVSAFIKFGVIGDNDLAEEGASFEAASEMLYMCHLIPLIFAEAYTEISKQLDGDVDDAARQKAIESLKRSFNL